MDKKSMFIFTIGPVQTFISQARKARDLYTGSYLLAFIMGETIKKMKEYDKTIEVVFPTAKEGEYNIPNRVVAIVKNYEDDDKRKLGTALEVYAKDCLMTIGEDLLKKINEKIDEKLKKTYKDQIEAHLEVFWIFRDFDKYTDGYKEGMKRLHEIKQIKLFSPNEEEPSRKCSLNPNKNALFTNLQHTKNKLISINTAKYPYFLGGKEGLSAIGFIKRGLYLSTSEKILQSYRKEFPSVSEIVIRNCLGSGEYQSLLEGIGKENINRTDFETINELVKKIREEEAFKKQKILTSYYAIIKFDGDNMGDLYTSVNLKPGKELKEFHKALSDKLCEFASFVKTNIEKEEGAVIYAGGEDFLGFIGMDSVFEVLQRFRAEFKKIDLTDYMDSSLTFSAGVSIAHIKTPLKEVVKKADEMESFAKDIDTDKDALGITIIKRSGPQLKMRLKFGEASGNIKEIQELISIIKNSEISNSFIYRLNEILKRITGIDKKTQNKMIECEIGRQLKKIGEEKDYSIYKDQFFKFYQKFDQIDDFISALEIILFFSKGGDLDVL